MSFGYEEGSTCGRNGCTGAIELHEVEDCSCHLSAPCYEHTKPRAFCPDCGWEESDDHVINDYVVSVDKSSGVYRCWEPRKLDSSKIDWRNLPHSSCSMIKEGVYPPGTTREDVEKLVVGTFGGRFAQFGNGTFKYIAYTD